MKLEEVIDGTYSYKNGLLYIDGNVNLSNRKLDKIPFDFYYVSGYFDCRYNQLTSLAGCPEKIDGWFDCSCNQLISLAGCPEKISGSFDCSHNQLVSLKGSPEEISGTFYCSCNQLTSLAGCPEKINGWFNCSYNQLVSLEGCPEKINGHFDCRNNPYLISLDEINDDIKNKLVLDDNQIEKINSREKIKILLNI
jgi:hypothetical protein